MVPALLVLTIARSHNTGGHSSWCVNIDRGILNGVIFIDLKKTFDTIDHKIFLKHLLRMALIKTP